MMQLKKNQPAFAVVDGPQKGHEYVHGVTYPDSAIPPGEKGRFDKVKSAPATDQAATTTTESKG